MRRLRLTWTVSPMDVASFLACASVWGETSAPGNNLGSRSAVNRPSVNEERKSWKEQAC